MPIKKNGFSLIELMIAISIIALLSTIGIVVYTQATKDARNTKRVQDLIQVKNALEIYRTQHGTYPISANFSCVTVLNTSLVPTFMPTLPSDPGNNDPANTDYCYEYQSDGNDYKIRTNHNLPGLNAISENDLNRQTANIDPASYTGTAGCAGTGTRRRRRRITPG